MTPAHRLLLTAIMLLCSKLQASDCTTHTFNIWQSTTCWLYGEQYTPSNQVPVTFVAPQAAGKYPLVLSRHGYTPTPVTCENDNGARYGAIVGKVCAAWYPDQRNFNPMPWNWGAPMFGHNYEGEVANAAFLIARERPDFDAGAGVALEGASEGGGWGIITSMLAPEPLRSNIATVYSIVPNTLIVKTMTNPAVFATWFPYDTRLFDFREQVKTGRLNQIYYSIHGATNDSLGLVDTEFYRLCDYYRIACFGTFDEGGHEATGEVGVRLPRTLYNEGQAPIRLDGILPVFTHSSANQWGQDRGFYNLGLSATAGEMQAGGGILIGLRYRRHTNIGGGIPDQPTSATFVFTLRRLHFPQWAVVKWQLGNQSGQTLAHDGELTIEGLTLESSTEYTDLILTNAGVFPGC